MGYSPWGLQRVRTLAKSGFCFSLANVFNMYFVFKISLAKEGCNWVLIFSSAGWHTLHLPLWHSLILAHRLCKPAAFLFLNFPGPEWEIRFSILLVIQDDGMGVSSTKLPTHLASRKR